MQRKVTFEDIKLSETFNDFSDKKFAVIRCCLLSTAPNSHELDISEEVLRRDAKTILGNFVVAKMLGSDATTHMADEIIMGYFPKDQEIEFEEEGEGDDKIVKAFAYAVISKQYAQDFYDMFAKDNYRKASIEMTVETGEDEHKVLAFDAFGLTCLGRTVQPSCKDADMSMVRFSNDEAEQFFAKVHSGKLDVLKNFAKERKNTLMAESKTYKVDKSKDAMSTKPWGEIDKNSQRNKIMEASNKASLVKDVYMDVQAGWEDAPSEKLRYPVMELKGDTFVYNRDGLASALGYAKKENETAVVSKVEKIYKKLGLDSDGKEEKMEDKKMAEDTKVEDKEAKMADEIEGRKAWAKIIKKVQDHEKGAYVDSVEKDHIIYTKDNVRYRVEADVKTDPDDKTVDAEIKWDTVKKDADQKMAAPEDKKLCDMSCDELMAKIEQMSKDIEDRDNIIMGKDVELEELRKFKCGIEDKEKAMAVEAVMADVKDCMSDEDYKAFRDEGLACKMAEVDAWKNKVKATAFGEVKKQPAKKTASTVWSFAAPVDVKTNKSGSVWDRL